MDDTTCAQCNKVLRTEDDPLGLDIPTYVLYKWDVDMQRSVFVAMFCSLVHVGAYVDGKVDKQ